MHLMRESWTDDRLDDLNAKVDRGFAETKDEFAAVRAEMRAGFDRVDRRFEKVDQRFEHMEERFDERFDQLHQMLLRFCWVMVVTLVGLIVPVIGLDATKL